GVAAEWIAARVEDDRLGDRILNGLSDDAARGEGLQTSARDMGPRVEAGDLPKTAAEGVDREELAVLVPVRPERVGRGLEEGSPPIHRQELAEGVDAPEVRELEETLAVLKEDVVDRKAYSREGIHGGPGQVQVDEVLPETRHPELGHDPAAG